MAPAGQLRERVTFQQRALDENEDRLGPWEQGSTVWARAQVKIGGEGVREARQQGLQTVDFEIRATSWSRTITSAWRALWRGQVYNLSAPVPSEDRAFILISGRADGSNG